MPAPIMTGLLYVFIPLIALVYMINPALGEQLKQVFESSFESFLRWAETDAGHSFLNSVLDSMSRLNDALNPILGTFFDGFFQALVRLGLV